MFSKYLTIVFIPLKTSAVRKIRITFPVFIICFLVLSGLFGGITYMAIDYFNIRSRIQDQRLIQAEYERQRDRIKRYYQNDKRSQFHYEHLLTLNRKLKSMVMSSIATEKRDRLSRRPDENQKDNVSIASKKGILDIIASDSADIDSDLIYDRIQKFNGLITFFKNRQNPLSRIPKGWPTEGFLINKFGMHSDPFTGQMKPQNGIDISTGLYSPVYSPANGIVILTRKSEEFGNELHIDHGNGFITKYGHLFSFEVEVGEVVKKGQIIAQVGNTGKTTGARLYYEITLNAIPQNPVNYLYN